MFRDDRLNVDVIAKYQLIIDIRMHHHQYLDCNIFSLHVTELTVLLWRDSHQTSVIAHGVGVMPMHLDILPP